MKRFSNPFSRRKIAQVFSGLFNRSSNVSLVIATAVTGLGYILLALFPVLLLTTILKLTFGISAADSLAAWFSLLVWLIIGAVASVVSFSLFRFKMHMPSGLGLKEDKAPKLYALIDELREEYKAPKVKRIIIHDHFSLELIPVPRFGLPILKTNVLYIGLPVLQCLSPAQFKGALAHRLGQYSAVHNKLSHWIYRMRQYCQQYQRSYAKHKQAVYLPIQWFFRFYTPVLNRLTASVARKDELEGDAYALNIMNDEDLADMVLRYEVCNHFLKTKYWPKMHSLVRKNPANPEHTPHIAMAKVVRNSLTENEFAQIMNELMQSESNPEDSTPDLHTRLENLGQRKLNMPPPVMETAAQRYLGDAFGAVLKLLDKQWLAKYTPSARSKHKRAASTSTTHKEDTDHEGSSSEERQRLNELRERARQSKLASHEAFEMASLMEKVQGKVAAIALYQQILRQNPKHADALFAVGRILISQNDPSGVNILERAMQLNSGCVAQGCWMLAKYFKATGDEVRSKHYLERAASVSAAA